MSTARASLRAPRRAIPSDTGTRLGFALLAYLLCITLIVTLLPFRFAWPQTFQLVYYDGPFDIVANVLLFVPLGFLYRYTRPRAHLRPVIAALGAGALLSLAIESLQLLEAARTSSALDIAANAAGAALGAAARGRLARVAPDGRVIGWLGLELPLMGLVYLLVPLLWVSALASQGEPARSALALLIGAFGAILLGGMQRHYFGPARASKPRETAAFALAWFVAGAFPALPSYPVGLACGALGVAALCWWEGARRAPQSHHNRRFEVRLLALAAPMYVGYLALTHLAALAAGVGPWTLHLGFTDAASDRIEILRLLELIAASTLAGYMVAEVRGRTLTRYRDALRALFACGLGLALAGELVRGIAQGEGASPARALFLVAATLYGGWLYYLQRAHVMRVLSHTERARGSEPG